MSTKINWTNETWNPVIGCSHVHLGCDNCYAERMATRLAAMPQTAEKYAGLTKDGRWTGEVRCVESELDRPLHWKKPRVVFVPSMGDLFHEAVPDAFVDRVLDVMVRCPQHTFVVLTKRPEWAWNCLLTSHHHHYPKNLVLGISVSDQEALNAPYLPALLVCTSGRRILSVEPLLGPLSFWGADWLGNDPYEGPELDPLGSLAELAGVIVGGESGPGARPMQADWVRTIRDECAEADVPFFFKQWGEFDEHGRRVGKKAAGRVLDGRTHDDLPWSLEG